MNLQIYFKIILIDGKENPQTGLNIITTFIVHLYYIRKIVYN